VLENKGDVVEDWIVMFCPGWHEKCQSLLPSYELLGVQWEDKLNTALMSSRVRFAKVDCATEKRLCVSLGIDDYPSVIHYKQQQRVNAWFGGAPGLVRWVKEELQPPKRRAAKASSSQLGQSQLHQALDKAIDQAISQPQEQTCTTESVGKSPKTSSALIWHILRPLTFVLILAIVAKYVWSLYAHVRSRPSEVSKPGTSPNARLQRNHANPRCVPQSLIL